MTDGAEWKHWIGRKGAEVSGPYPVSLAAIGYLAEAVEDERLAGQIASGKALVAPRSFVTIASRVPNWRPNSATGPATFMQAMLVPLAANSAVNTSIDQRYFAKLFPGDSVSTQSTLTSITPKRTKLGDGYFLTEEIDHRNQHGVLIAKSVNTMLRFSAASGATREAAPGGAAAPAPLPAPRAPSAFSDIVMPITMTKLAAGAGAVRDFSPLHHDIEFARRRGHPTAFVSYSFQLSLVMRALGEWFQGDDRVARVRLVLKTPIYLGKTAVCHADRKTQDTTANPGIEIVELSLTSEDGVCTTGIAEIASGAA